MGLQGAEEAAPASPVNPRVRAGLVFLLVSGNGPRGSGGCLFYGRKKGGGYSDSGRQRPSPGRVQVEWQRCVWLG